MSLKDKYLNLGKNIGIFTISNFSVKVVTFLVLPLYTYYLSTEEYAVIDLVNTTAQLLLPFLTLCVIEAVLRFGISQEYSLKSVFTNSTLIIAAGCVILPVLIFIMQFFIDLESIMVYFFVIYCLQVFNSLFAAFAKAINRVKAMAVISMITSISIVLFNVLFVAVLRGGVEGYFKSVIIGNAIGVCLYIKVCNVKDNFCLKNLDKKVLKDMLMYAIPLIPNSVFWWINTSLDRYALVAFTSMSIVGMYSVANKIPTIISTVTSIFSQAWNLSAFQAYGDQDKEKFYDNMYTVYRSVLVICTSGVILFSRVFAKILFAKDFYGAWIFIPLLTMGVYYNSLNSFLGSLFTASKKTKDIFYTTAMGSVINIVLNFLLIKAIGAQGAALATLVSYFVVWVARVKRVRKIFDFRVNYVEDILVTVLLVIESLCVIKNELITVVISAGMMLFIWAYSLIKGYNKIRVKNSV